MRSSVYDYISATLCVILSLLSVILFTNSFHLTENSTTLAIYGALFAFFAMLTCPGLTNIWTNYIYQKATTNYIVIFCGRLDFLEKYQINAGEFLRGITFFTLVFNYPAILTGNWKIAILATAISTIFAYYGKLTINNFKDYLYSHLNNTNPNSP